MSLFVCAKCGCVDNTATSSYWMLTNEYMVDEFDYAKELQPYKGMGLCSECGRQFLNDPKRTCFHGKEYLICKDPDPEGNFIIVGVNFRILPAGTPIVTKDGSII